MKDAQSQPLVGPSHPANSTYPPSPCFKFEIVPGCVERVTRNESSWKLEERLKYLAFMDYYCLLVEKMQAKELWGLCRLLSVFILTRNANQCRIYHKQMLSKFQGVRQMLRVIQLQLPEFKELMAVYTDQLSIIFDKNRQQIAKREETVFDQEYFVPQSQQLERYKEPELESEGKQLSKQESVREYQQKMNKEMVPTDTTIKAQVIGFNSRTSRPSISASMFQGGSFQTFPSFQNPVINEMTFVSPFWNGFYAQSFPSPMQPTREEKRQREWQECHQLFLCWQEKLSKLLEEEQQNNHE